MSTTTMKSPHQISTGPLKNKRKELDGVDVFKPSRSAKLAKPSVLRPRPTSPTTPKPSQPVSNNQLLAGYLAHEFIAKGTLFGKPWDPARAEAVPVSASSADARRLKSPIQKVKPEPSAKPEARVEKHQRYAEVANLLKTDGAHLPGIVNPTLLARFLQL